MSIATKRHMAHLDPTVGEGFLFCGESETIQHLFLECGRLGDMLEIVRAWCTGLQTPYMWQLYIGGPRYTVAEKVRVCLLNIFGQVKLGTWLSRKNRRLGTDSCEAADDLKGLVAARLRVEFGYYSLVQRTPEFL